MMKRLVLALVSATSWLAAHGLAAPVELIFPQVAAGVANQHIETVLVLQNPHADPLAVTLSALGIELPDETEFELQPHEVRRIVFSGSGPVEVGSVRLRGELASPLERTGATISALAQITTRAAPGSPEILAQVSVPAQPLAVQAAVPVFRGADNVDDTGVAVAWVRGGVLRLTLRDAGGEVLRTRTMELPAGSEGELSGRFALFASELFPDFPGDLQTGSLALEVVEPVWSPPAFSIVALYTRDDLLETVSVAPLDQAALYRVRFASPPSDPAGLAGQYRADLDAVESGGEALLTMPSRTAEALARNPAVAGIEPSPSSGEAFSFDFETGPQGWQAGFADYPAEFEDNFELRAEHVQLAASLGGGGAMLLEGFNQSDDLFMYLQRRITGLDPAATYRVKFLVEVATDVPRGQSGIGGAPGEGVTIKAGAVNREPLRVLDPSGDYRLDVDKGQQANPGADALVLGDLAKSTFNFVSGSPELKTLTSHLQTFEVTTDAEGSVWVVVGTDSGFEGRSTVIYNRIEVRFFEQ